MAHTRYSIYAVVRKNNALLTVYYSQDQKSRNLMYVIPSFAHLSPVLSSLNRV